MDAINLTDKTNTDDQAGSSRSSTSRAAKVEEAVSYAIDLVREFSERDPHDGDVANPWKDPQKMLDQLDKAREAIVLASSADEDASSSAANKKKMMTDENDFRVCYMDLVTNAFADVLEDMRNNSLNSSSSNNNSGEELDVDILVDCLQSGMDFLSGEEQEFLMMDNCYYNDDEYNENNNEDQDGGGSPTTVVATTAHEKRQLQLGLCQEVH